MRRNGRRQAKGYKQQNYVGGASVNSLDNSTPNIDEKLAQLNKAADFTSDNRTIEEKIAETLKNSGAAREKIRVNDPSKLQVKGEEKKGSGKAFEVKNGPWTFVGDKRSADMRKIADALIAFGKNKCNNTYDSKVNIASKTEQFAGWYKK